jgi:hypothetical protein
MISNKPSDFFTHSGRTHGKGKIVSLRKDRGIVRSGDNNPSYVYTTPLIYHFSVISKYIVQRMKLLSRQRNGVGCKKKSLKSRAHNQIVEMHSCRHYKTTISSLP